MWDLLKSFLAFGLATSLEKLIAFLLLPLYTKVFSVVEYGYIDLIQVTFIIITAFSVLQFETSLQRYYYEYRGKIKVLFISTVCKHTIFRLDTHYSQPYLCAVTFNNNDYGKRKSKLSGGI